MTARQAKPRDSNNAALVEGILGETGELPCDPPDDCGVCCLFSGRQADESLVAWGDRLNGRMRMNDYRSQYGG